MPSQSTDDRRAVQLLRFSPRPTEDDILSLAVQDEWNRKYANTFNLQIVATFKDEFTSARKVPLDKRDGGAEMLAYIKQHKIRHVIFLNVARVFRNHEDGHRWRRKFRKMKVTMHFAGEGGENMFNADTAFGEAAFALALILAAVEPKQTSERTSKAMKFRQANGQRQSGRAPFGTKIVGDSLVPDIPEQLLGQEIQVNALKGMSQRENAADLNARGFKFRGEPVKRSSVVAGLEYVANLATA